MIIWVLEFPGDTAIFLMITREWLKKSLAEHLCVPIFFLSILPFCESSWNTVTSNYFNYQMWGLIFNLHRDWLSLYKGSPAKVLIQWQHTDLVSLLQLTQLSSDIKLFSPATEIELGTTSTRIQCPEPWTAILYILQRRYNGNFGIQLQSEL